MSFQTLIMDDNFIVQKNINKQIALWLLFLLLVLSFNSSTILAKEIASQKDITTFQQVFNAAVQGDESTVEGALANSLLNDKTNTNEAVNPARLLSEFQRQQLTIMLSIMRQDNDQAKKWLSQFTAEYGDNSAALIFAGTAWKQLSKQLSFFSFTSIYEKGLSAHIRAFELAPQNELYRALAGSSYTQIDSDNKPKQRALLSGYKNPNSGYHLFAQMDMAQNDRDHKLLVALADKAVSIEQNNILVMERAAQAFWTADKVKRAQQTFLIACLLPPPTDMFRYTWQNSCYIAGHLALNETKAYQKGVDALTQLLSINTLDTEFNREAKDMLKNLNEKLKIIQNN